MFWKSISSRSAIGQAGIGLRKKISSARRRNWSIQSGSFLYFEICSTISRLRPRLDLNEYCSGSLKPYLYSLDRSCGLTAISDHLLCAFDAVTCKHRVVPCVFELLNQLWSTR